METTGLTKGRSERGRYGVEGQAVQSHIVAMQDPINATRTAPVFQPRLPRRDRYDRCALFVSRVGERDRPVEIDPLGSDIL